MKVLSCVLILLVFSCSSVASKAENAKEMIHNISTLGYEVRDGKSWVDSKTKYVISSCSDNYNINKQLGISGQKDEPTCSKTDDYEGACWVTNLGFTSGSYKAEICYQSPSDYAECKVLSNGESSGKFSLEMKNLSYYNPYYMGSFNGGDDCPDYKHNINSLGYVYIKEATDKQYTSAIDFSVRFCRQLAENYNPSNCESPQICPCDDYECRANNFIPPKTSKTWKKASSKAKNCYLCLQKYRAVSFYCNKVYQCLHKNKNSYPYELAKSDNREYLDDLYGEGSYLCGYYDGKLCGCGKSRLSAGPRHFLRVARQVSANMCETKDDFILNPQCNLFGGGIYARQFHNNYENHDDADCPYEVNPEFGYKKRGTFFSPKITIVSGVNERLIGYDSSLLLGNELYYYNSPIGESTEYKENNKYNFPTAKKILFSNFYPVIFTIGALNNVKDENGKCLPKPSGDVSYVMLRMEYNLSTNESALVAYRVRFLDVSPSQLEDGRLLLADGSISKFIVNDTTFIENIKNAKNISPVKDKMEEGEFKYDYEPNLNFHETPLPEKGKYLYFENIGKVARPPLKYSYDEGSIYLNSPIVLKQDLSIEDEGAVNNAERLKISIIPANLSSFNSEEFSSDKQLSTFTKKIAILSYMKDAFEMTGDVIKNKSSVGASSEAIIYMKRFSVKYNNSCVFLKTMIDESQKKYLLDNPPSSLTTCDALTTLDEKMACIVSYVLLYECNGYVSCLDKETSITACQNEDRIPKIKLFGTDTDLPEYKKNIDFRSYAQICVDEGFEFADKMSEYSNTKLFGDFGYAPYDYTIRWKKNSTGIASNTPGRPLSIKYKDAIHPPEDFQDPPKYIITMDIDYFSSSKTNRSKNMLKRLMGIPMLDQYGYPSEITAFNQYASDCTYNSQICENRYEVKHRLVNETLGTLCVSAGLFNNGKWTFDARDFGVDYHVYVPLRCQYLSFSGIGAGGAGFTTEGPYSNCMAKYHIIESSWFLLPFPLPGFLSGAYLRTPKFDATGSQGGVVSAKINLNLLPIFDGYLSVSVGSATSFSRAQIVGEKIDAPEKCYIGVTPYHEVYVNTRDWFVKGGTHGFWFLPPNAKITYSGGSAYYDGKKVDDYYDYRKGNTEIAFDTYGGAVSSFDEKAYIQNQYDVAKQNVENNIEGFSPLIADAKKYRLLEFYFVSLMHLSYRLQHIDNAIYNAEHIAYQAIKTKYEDELTLQRNLKNEKENKKNDNQTLLDTNDSCRTATDKVCFIKPSGTETCVQSTATNYSSEKSRCATLTDQRNNWQNEINTINAELITIDAEIARLTNIIDNDLFPENEIREYDVASSSQFSDVKSKIDNINNIIVEEKNDWINDGGKESRNKVTDEQLIDDIRDSYGSTDVDELNNVINEYATAITEVNDVKKTYCNTLSEISIDSYNVNNLKTMRSEYENQFNDIVLKLSAFSEFTEQRNAINELFKKCKTHTDDLIGLSSSPPTTYVQEIKFKHSNNYGLLKSIMCFGFDKLASDCEESESLGVHAKTDGSENLCIKTSIINAYNDVYSKMSIDKTTKIVKACQRTDVDMSLYECNSGDDNCQCIGDKCIKTDIELPDVSCNEGDSNCDCQEVTTRSMLRITDDAIQENQNSIDDKFLKIKQAIDNVVNLKSQLDECENDSPASGLGYQYLATAKRGSSPIDARIFRKKQGQGNVPYWDSESQRSGELTSFQRPFTDDCCGDNCLFDIAVNHDYKCLQKSWIESKRIRVVNDGYGIFNNSYLISADSNDRSLGRSSEISKDLDVRAALGGYEKPDGMSGDGPGSENTHSLVKGSWNKYEELKQDKSNAGYGGSFHHLEGAGAGIAGSATLAISSINIKQFEYNGEKYPELNNSGIKQLTDEENLSDSKCIIKCPPMHAVVKNFGFYFPEIKKTAPIDVLCEYSGEPENDMEAITGKSVAPKKCYILTESVVGVGETKGKIIISSDGICPIAKCSNGTWGVNARAGTEIGVAQYDRNTGICRPKEKYGDEVKSSNYFMMMFDKNIYSGFAYIGSRSSPLTANVPQYKNGAWNLNSYEIATCADTKIDAYFVDTYDQLYTISKFCSIGGFWEDQTTESTPNLYPVNTYTGTCMTGEDEYSNCTINDSADSDRNNAYMEHNMYLNKREYLIKDVNYLLNKKNGSEFSTEASGNVVSGIRSVKTAGRTVFKDKIKCPMLDADRYDFEDDYTGNAIWDFADEHTTAIATRCKQNSIPIGALPRRVCKVNGLWGPVIGVGCGVFCESTVDKNGTKWSVTSDDIATLSSGETVVTISGACSGKYLNSQNYKSNSGNVATRTCNLITGEWGAINKNESCNDGLVSLEDNYAGQEVATPYARTMIFTGSGEYDSLLNELDKASTDVLDAKSSYQDSLYLAFKPDVKHSDIFDSDYYEVDNDYVDVQIEEKNFDSDGNSYITDRNGFRLIDKMPNNDYYVISVSNALRLKAFEYMLAQGDNERNEFLNVQNWMSMLNESQMNFTGQWAWKANLSQIKSKPVYDSTSSLAHEVYKNAKLLILIPKMTNNNKNLQHIALFSPYLAKQKCAGSDLVESDEENIKFRYLFNIKDGYKVNNKPYAIIVYDGISSSNRLYRFEWEKGSYSDWTKSIHTKHAIGSKDCDGKYFGHIRHNTTKHIMYTPEPTSSKEVFASLFCYDGRIFGFHAFRSSFIQDENLTDKNTQNILLSADAYGNTGASKAYNEMKNYFDTLGLTKDYFSDYYDANRESAKNAYIFSLMKMYWQAHIFPKADEQKNFIKYYQPNVDVNYTKVSNQYVKDVMKEYALGSDGKYYRVVPREAEWISGTSITDSIDNIYDVIKSPVK